MKLDKEIIQIKLANEGLLFKDFCQLAGITRTSLNLILSGKRDPRPQTVGKIAKALNVPVEEIIKRG